MADAPSHSYIRSQFIPVTSAPASPEPPKVMETTEKPAVPGKKKGQAAAVKKGPKRGKGGTTGGPKQSKKVAKKAPASDASVNSGAEAEADGDAADSDEGDESDHGPYCICRGPDDHRFMIGCDVCEDWFHGECVGIDKDVGEHLIERFVCPNCSNRDEGIITVFKKTCGLPRCKKPARLYDGQPKEERSHFCSDEHKQLWWERCLSTLPKKKNPGSKVPEALTQGEFVAILESGLATFQDTAAGTPAVSGGDTTMSDSVEGKPPHQSPSHSPFTDPSQIPMATSKGPKIPSTASLQSSKRFSPTARPSEPGSPRRSTPGIR
jgi:PHD finger protein